MVWLPQGALKMDQNHSSSTRDFSRATGWFRAKRALRQARVAEVRPIGLSLSTLVMLRWIAVAGQLLTVVIVSIAFEFPFALLPCLLATTALAVSNLVLMASCPRRLSQMRATLVLGFDLLQLASLIGFTGGLQNPFALLLLAPVTVSATILSRRATLALTALAVGGSHSAFLRAFAPALGDSFGRRTAFCLSSGDMDRDHHVAGFYRHLCVDCIGRI